MGRSPMFRRMNLAELRRRFLLIAGVGLLIAGAIILSIGLIGYFDQGQGEPTADVAAEEPTVQNLDYMPAVPYNPPPPTAEPVPTPVPVAAPLRIVVESIGVDAPVVEMGMDENNIPHVPLNGQDVAWYNFSAKPGAGSNAVLAGHINWEKAPAVFAELDQVEPGDVIRLIAEDGRELTYEVTANFYVDPDDPESLKVMAATPTDIVTLITCGGRWLPNPSERFGGSYANRTIVQGKLIDSAVAESGAVGGR